MNVRSFERLIAAEGAPRASLDAITRHLRAMGLLPVGGRGTGAPDIAPEGAALILLTLAGVANPNSPGQVREFVSSCGWSGERDRQPDAALDFLTAILADPSLAASVTELRVSRTTADVTVLFEDGRRERFRSLNEDQLRDHGAKRPGFGVEGHLTQELLVRASAALSRPAMDLA